MPLFGVPSRFPGPLSVATVHADPVSRVTEVGADRELSSSVPVGVVPIRLAPSGSVGCHGCPWIRSAPAVSVSCVPTPLRPPRCRFGCALFGTMSMMKDTKSLVKTYFRSHRVTHRSFRVAPRSSRFIHRSSTGTATQYTVRPQVRPHLASLQFGACRRRPTARR